MTRFRPVALGTAAFAVVFTAAITGGPLIAQQKPASGPIARYDMRAGTVTGVGAMGRGAGAGMAMVFGGGGGGNAAQHELYLRLGSSRPADKGLPTRAARLRMARVPRLHSRELDTPRAPLHLMFAYLVRRLWQMVPTLLGVIILVFALFKFFGSDHTHGPHHSFTPMIVGRYGQWPFA